jgi:hypothetical protein
LGADAAAAPTFARAGETYGSASDLEAWSRGSGAFNESVDDDDAIQRLFDRGLLFYDEDGLLLFWHGAAGVKDPYDVVSAAIENLDVSVDEMVRAIRGGTEGEL